MDYQQFKRILNHKIFKKSKVDLIEKIAKDPKRYIGLQAIKHHINSI